MNDADAHFSCKVTEYSKIREARIQYLLFSPYLGIVRDELHSTNKSRLVV